MLRFSLVLMLTFPYQSIAIPRRGSQDFMGLNDHSPGNRASRLQTVVSLALQHMNILFFAYHDDSSLPAANHRFLSRQMQKTNTQICSAIMRLFMLP